MKKTLIMFGGMHLPEGNAATERAKTIGDFFVEKGFDVILVGESEKPTSGDFGKVHFYTYAKPKSALQWLKKMISIHNMTKLIDVFQGKKYVMLCDYMSIATKRILRHYSNNKEVSFIFDIGEWFSKSMYFFPKNLIKDFDTYCRMKKIVPKANNVIVASEFLFNFYKKSVPNMVILPALVKIDAERINNIVFKETEKINLIYAGFPGFKKEKERIDIAIQAVLEANEILKKSRFVFRIVGMEIEDGFNETNESILYLGKKKHAECLQLIKASDFSIIPRERTRKNMAGFPTKISETFACGTPVIITDISDVKKYVFGLNGFIVDPCTKEAFVKILLHIETVVSKDTQYLANTKRFTLENNKLIASTFYDSMMVFIDKLGE